MQDRDLTILLGDALETLRTLDDGSVNCVVTSPPYWGLRDYGTGTWEGGDESCDHVKTTQQPRAARAPARLLRPNHRRSPTPDVCGKCGARRVDRQLGLEPTPDAYVAAMVAVFAEVRRVLADDGTCWLNLGSSYFGNPGGPQGAATGERANRTFTANARSYERAALHDVQPTKTLGWSDCGHNNYRPGVVLDPFGGSGTTALVARKHGRRAILIELNEEYARMAATRCHQLSLLAEAGPC